MDGCLTFFMPTSPVLVDNGPLPIDDATWWDTGLVWTIIVNFHPSLIMDGNCSPSSFLIEDNGGPRNIQNVGVNITGQLTITMDLPLPTGLVTTSQIKMDPHAKRDPDGYLVFPWGPLETEEY